MHARAILVGTVCLAVVWAVGSAGAADDPVIEGKPLKAWLEQLSSDAAPVRWKAATVLGNNAALAVPALAEMKRVLSEETSGTVQKALTAAVRAVEAEAAKAKPPARSDPKTGGAVGKSSAPAAGGAAAAVNKLLAVCHDGTEDQKIAALRAAAEYGEDAAAGAPAACELATRTGADLRIAAVAALRRIAPPLALPVDKLINHDDPERHIQAADELGSMGRAAAATIPVLMMHCQTPHPASRGVGAARGSVWSGDAALETLKADLRAMVRIAPEDPRVIKLLIRLQGTDRFRISLPGPRPGDRETVVLIDARPPAVIALSRIAARNPESRPEVVPVLLTNARMVDREPLLGLLAIHGLGGCGKDAVGARGMELLRGLTRHREPEVRETAFEALKELGKDTVAAGKDGLQILSSGTGFLVAPGLLLTNVHVIDGAGKVMVRLPKTDKPVPGEVIARHHRPGQGGDPRGAEPDAAADQPQAGPPRRGGRPWATRSATPPAAG